MKHKIAERPKCRVCGRSMVKTRMGVFICYICGEWLCPADKTLNSEVIRLYRCVIPFPVRDTRKHKDDEIQVGERFILRKIIGDNAYLSALKGRRDDLVIRLHNLKLYFIKEGR